MKHRPAGEDAIMVRLVFASVLMIAVTVPSIAQTVVPNSAYTKPQRLIAVEGARRLNLFCVGVGAPAVVLEAGSGNGMITWRHVQAEIARFTKVCAYDRAGLGFSDPAERPSTDANIVDDLHRLLAAAPIPTPIVFVGHSLGGEVGLLFAAKYPGDVAGAVLVDPGFPDMLQTLQSALQPEQDGSLLDGLRTNLAANKACLALAQKGLLKHPVTKQAKGCVYPSFSPDKLDATLRGAVARQLALPSVWRAMISEFESFLPDGDHPSADSVAFAGTILSFGNKPLIVLTRGNQEGAPGVSQEAVAAMEGAWKEGHDRIAALSTRGRNVIVHHSGHYIQIDQPAAVIDAVRRVVDDVRHP